jgi:proline iminopeptidase
MKKAILFILSLCYIFSCNQSGKAPDHLTGASTKDSTYEVKTGGAKMIRIDGKYNVWTKKVGNGKIKVLLLHGGPAFTHNYFECFEDFLPKEGIEFYYYDQLGCGNSDIPADTTLWNLPRFVEEV